MSRGERDDNGIGLFAAELAAARAGAGLSQEELGARINYSGSLVAMIEGRRRVPTLAFASRCDEALSTVGTFGRLHKHARNTPLPAWFRPYADIEAAATQIRSWEPMLVPGLLQTEDYARALLSVEPDVTPDELEERISARLARQSILDGETPPRLWALLDEAVLVRGIGGAKVMHEQLLHLIDMTCRPNVNIQIVPLSAGAHVGLLSAFAIAEADDTRVVFLETPTEGLIVEAPGTVSRLMLTFDTLRLEALPRGASADLITMRAGELWT